MTSRRTWEWVAPVLLASVVLGGCGTASTETESPCAAGQAPANVVWAVPDNGEVDVPVDVRFITPGSKDWADANATADWILVRLLDGGQTERVETLRTRVIERDDWGGFVAHTPLTNLEPNTRYRFAPNPDAMVDPMPFVFTTGERVGSMPSVPDESDRTVVFDRDRRFRFGGVVDTVIAAYDSRTLPGDDLIRLATFDPNALDRDALDGEVQVISGADTVTIGRTECSDNWAEVGPRASAPLHVAVVNRHGHVSQWRQFDDVSIPGGGGCAMGGSPDGSRFAALLLLALVAVRRRSTS